jgi:hypothetical protein
VWRISNVLLARLARPELLLCIFLFLASAPIAVAQDNYEIQVYGSETMLPRATMIELHSNITLDGSKTSTDGTYPTNHSVRETIEITHGFNDWFEMGFYIFSSAGPDYGWQWAGDHIRPRVRVPEQWKWPVGVSLSAEIGYQPPRFSPDKWTLEIRPIVDKKIGPWYLAFNPSFDRSLHGPNSSRGFEFSPNAKFSYDVTRKVALGLEYYGALGPVTGFDPLADQQQQFFPTLDLDLSPQWEFNTGLGVGVTHGTDHLILKFIVGRRFGGRHKD